MSAWELTGVRKTYPARLLGGGPAVLAVDDATLTVGEGERVALIGESGSGKTTLARIGLGLVPRDAGTVRVLGEDTASWGASRWLAARRHVQLLFQEPRSMLHPGMRLGALLAESAGIHRPSADPGREVARVLDEVGLTGRDRALPHELSGGEQRRAGIARLLLAKPRLVVADEPTAGLDAALKASILELLLDRVGKDCAVVLISHDLPVVAWACERFLVMQNGRIVDAFAGDAGVDGRHPYTLKLFAAAGIQLEPP
jgi:peptide/nickel transport system ATP-binding protein